MHAQQAKNEAELVFVLAKNGLGAKLGDCIARETAYGSSSWPQGVFVLQSNSVIPNHL
jgi:hypothetical protein